MWRRSDMSAYPLTAWLEAFWFPIAGLVTFFVLLLILHITESRSS